MSSSPTGALLEVRDLTVSFPTANGRTDVVSHLHGMFAFVITERDTGRVVLARDRLGIKPLYLAETPGKRLRFASTLPALLRAGDVDTSIDPVALHHYLTWHAVVPAPRTWRGLRQCAPLEVTCRPTTPITMTPIQTAFISDADSPNSQIPSTATAAVPTADQTA